MRLRQVPVVTLAAVVLLAATALADVVEKDEFTYIDELGEKQGPVSTDTIKGLFFAGKLGEKSLVYKQGDADWRELSEVPGLFQSIQESRPDDPRSEFLYDINIFSHELQTAPVDAQMRKSDVFCAKRGAMQQALSKTRLKLMLMASVPELQETVRELEVLRQKANHFKMDVEQVQKQHDQTVANAKKGQELAKERIRTLKEALRIAQAEPMSVRWYKRARGMVISSLEVNKQSIENLFGVELSMSVYFCSMTAFVVVCVALLHKLTGPAAVPAKRPSKQAAAAKKQQERRLESSKNEPTAKSTARPDGARMRKSSSKKE